VYSAFEEIFFNTFGAELKFDLMLDNSGDNRDVYGDNRDVYGDNRDVYDIMRFG